MQKQTGFTLIELIVVILILGILSATALPRFVNVENEAQTASHQGVAGAFQAAVMLSRAKWLAAGKPAAGGINIDTGIDVQFNANGWPINISGTAAVDAAGCSTLWALLLQQNAPTVNAVSGAGSDYSTPNTAGTTCIFDSETTTTIGDLDINYDTNTGAITIDQTLDGA